VRAIRLKVTPKLSFKQAANDFTVRAAEVKGSPLSAPLSMSITYGKSSGLPFFFAHIFQPMMGCDS